MKGRPTARGPAAPATRPLPPSRLAHLGLGLGAALCAGSVVGGAEGLFLLAGTRPAEYQAFGYGAALYGLAGVVVGAPVAVLLALFAPAVGLGRERAWSASFAAVAAALGTFVLAGRAAHAVAGLPTRPSVSYALAGGMLALFVAWFGGRLLARTPLGVLATARGTAAVWGGGMAIAALLSVSPAPGAASNWVPAREGATDAPSIVLIVVDGLRGDALDPAHMPALSAFADDAVRFDQAVAASGALGPAIASILTSAPPSVHGRRADGERLGGGIPTLAEVLRDGGYATGGLPAAGVAGAARGFDRGFDGYALVRNDPLGAGETSNGLELYGRLRAAWERAVTSPRGSAWHAPATEQLDGALAFLAANDASRAFLFVQLSEPDAPWFEGGQSVGVGGRSPTSAEAARTAYEQDLSTLDAALGAFFQRLRDVRRYDRVAVVVVGARGVELGDRGVYGPGEDLHDDVLHVPLLVKLPGGAWAGLKVPWQVRTVDVAPTLVELAGLPPPGAWHGAALFDDWFEDDLARAHPLPDEDGLVAPGLDWADHPGSRPALAEQRAPGGDLVVVRDAGRKVARLRGAVVPRAICLDPTADPAEATPLPSDEPRCRRADLADAILGGWSGERPPPTPAEGPPAGVDEEE